MPCAPPTSPQVPPEQAAGSGLRPEELRCAQWAKDVGLEAADTNGRQAKAQWTCPALQQAVAAFLAAVALGTEEVRAVAMLPCLVGWVVAWPRSAACGLLVAHCSCCSDLQPSDCSVLGT